MPKEPDLRALLEEQAAAHRERRIAQANATANEQRSLARAYRREADEANARVEALLALEAADVKVRPIEAEKSSKSRHSPSVACTFASDWHVDESVKPSEVPGGRNRYSREIAEQRIDNYARRFVKLANSARSDTTIDTAVVFLAGDLFSGWIHPELYTTTTMSPIESVRWLEPRVAGFLEYIADHGDFKTIHVLCVVGNHSRITLKEFSAPARASLEYLLYHYLAKHFKERRQLRFQITESKREVTPIAGVRVRWMHGNDWGYAGGVGGVLIPMMNRTKGWDVEEHADFTVCGHWHNYFPSARHLVNGSLIGYTPYGSKYGFEPPQQAFFLISEKYRRITLQAPIFLE